MSTIHAHIPSQALRHKPCFRDLESFLSVPANFADQTKLFQTLEACLQAHDKLYFDSSDNRAYKLGKAEEDLIDLTAKHYPETKQRIRIYYYGEPTK